MVIVSRSVADFIVELSVTVGDAKLAVGGEGRKLKTEAVSVTVPLKFMILVTFMVEEAVELGPSLIVVGVAKILMSGPITSTST